MPRWLGALICLAWTLANACGGLPTVIASRERSQVWIDTDAGFGIPGLDVDDGWAMVAAFHSKSLQVVGVSAVFGEAPMDDAYAVAGELAGLFGPSELPVYPGAESPRDLGRETNAAKALAVALQHQPLKILALGPLTNVATVLRLHPELQKQIVEIVAVAGRRPTERLAWNTADTKLSVDPNFARDPEAFRTVLAASSVPLTLVPLEAASNVRIGEGELHRLEAGGEAARTLAGPSREWLALWRERFGIEGFSPFEAAAAMVLSTPAVAHCGSEPAEIVLALPEGPYLLASPSFHGNRVVRYCAALHPQFKEALLRRILAEEEFIFHDEPNLR